MTRLSMLGRTLAVATVVAGILMFTLAVQGVTRVDTKLELAAMEQKARRSRRSSTARSSRGRQQHREREDV